MLKVKKAGIVCAGDDEFTPFLSQIDECKVSEKAMLKFYEGKIGGVDVVVLFSGVGKVNAAIAAELLIEVYGVDAVINAGCAGGMDSRLHIFDTVISTEIAYHDVAEDILTEFHPWMESIYFQADSRLLELSREAISKLKMKDKVFWGRMVTGEAFIVDEDRQRIMDIYAPLTVDMETAAIAHVCYVNHIPFIAVRCITDTAEHSGVERFEENCQKASGIARDITAALLEEMKGNGIR